MLYRVDAYFLDETDTVLASAHVSPFRGIVNGLLDKTLLFHLMCDRSPFVYFLKTNDGKFEPSPPPNKTCALHFFSLAVTVPRSQIVKYLLLHRH